MYDNFTTPHMELLFNPRFHNKMAAIDRNSRWRYASILEWESR